MGYHNLSHFYTTMKEVQKTLGDNAEIKFCLCLTMLGFGKGEMGFFQTKVDKPRGKPTYVFSGEDVINNIQRLFNACRVDEFMKTRDKISFRINPEEHDEIYLCLVGLLPDPKYLATKQRLAYKGNGYIEKGYCYDALSESDDRVLDICVILDEYFNETKSNIIPFPNRKG